MIQFQREKPRIDIIFTLTLFLLFAISAILLVIYSLRIYSNTSQSMDQNFATRTYASYIREKIRQSDYDGKTSIVDKDGVSMLCMTLNADGTDYGTYIYGYEGQLYEITVSADSTFALGDGQQILPVSKATFSLPQDCLLKTEITSAAGKSEIVYTTIKSVH